MLSTEPGAGQTSKTTSKGRASRPNVPAKPLCSKQGSDYMKKEKRSHCMSKSYSKSNLNFGKNLRTGSCQYAKCA